MNVGNISRYVDCSENQVKAKVNHRKGIWPTGHQLRSRTDTFLVYCTYERGIKKGEEATAPLSAQARSTSGPDRRLLDPLAPNVSLKSHSRALSVVVPHSRTYKSERVGFTEQGSRTPNPGES